MTTMQVWFANKRLMRTCDLLLATLTLILALEGKDRTVAMLDQQLKRLRRDQIVAATVQRLTLLGSARKCVYTHPVVL